MFCNSRFEVCARRWDHSGRARPLLADSCSRSATASAPVYAPFHTASLKDKQSRRKSVGDEEKVGKTEWHWLGRNGLGGDMTDAGLVSRRIAKDGGREDRG